MPEFHVTFGVQYRREQHPRSVNGVTPHPDGWITIVAPDEEAARRAAHQAFGEHWAFLNPTSLFNPEFFPRGELTRITVNQ